MTVNHLGIIPDGNRRWARAKALNPWIGHEKGIPRFNDVIQWCTEKGIKEVTFYTLSIQNFQRDKTELDFLFKYVRRELEKWKDEKEIFFNPVGNIDLLPDDIKQQCREVKEKTRKNTKLKVNLAIGYGGREEIVEAVKKIEGDITEQSITKNLLITSDVDLVIRTSGEQRTSNFLPWQTAYSEWFFSKKLWPEFDKEEFEQALKDYSERKRRYGK